MNAEIFAEWLRSQGYRVIHTPSSYWYEASPRVFQAFPYHWIIRPSEDEINDLVRQNHAVALRYSTPIESPLGKISYHAVYDKPTYTLESLDRRSRQNIRAGLKSCSVEPVDFQRLADEGWSLETDTAIRQGRKPAMSREAWRRRSLSAGDLPGFEVWGALVDGRLTATLLTFRLDDWSEFISQQCHHDFLSLRVNNSLTFVVTQNMVSCTEIHSVFYTIQSLDAPPSVDEFKFRMGFAAKPVRQRVALHPLIPPGSIKYAHTIMAKFLERSPDNPFYSKAEGVLRFYLQGKLPIEEQNWPECIQENRSELLLAQAVQHKDVQNSRLPVHP